MSAQLALRSIRAAMVATVGLIVLLAGCEESVPPLTHRAEAQSGARQFDLRGLSIPEGEIRSGGPPKDGIPAISEPQFLDAGTAKTVRPDERVIGVAVGDEARAYPLRILTRHEVVNDRIGERSLAVSYCPLCDSSFVFDRRISGREIEFGVSGLLYNSNVLMYDRNRGGREGLWSQLRSAAVSGEHADQLLRTLPFEVTTWADWMSRHPQTKVLSQQTGLRINYEVDPYAMYFRMPRLMFPTVPQAPTDRFPLKTPVLGVWNSAGSRAYPLPVFGEGPSATIAQTLGESSFTVVYDATAKSLRITEATGELDFTYAFWFAWYAFHPETEIHESVR